MFGFKDEHLRPFNWVFEAAGFETTNFIIESGTLLFLIIGFGLLYLVRKLLQWIANRFSDNWLTVRLKREQMANLTIVRFLFEGCFGLGLTAMISVLRVSSCFSVSINSVSFCSQTPSNLTTFGTDFPL